MTTEEIKMRIFEKAEGYVSAKLTPEEQFFKALEFAKQLEHYVFDTELTNSEYFK